MIQRVKKLKTQFESLVFANREVLGQVRIHVEVPRRGQGIVACVAVCAGRIRRKGRGADPLGAAASDVLGMVFRMGLRLIAIGVVAGVLVTFAATRVISSQLFGVSSVDPVTFGGVIAVIAVTGLAACYFPARRATRVDPMVALRYE